MEQRGLAFHRDRGPFGELTRPLSQAARDQLEPCNRSLPGGLRLREAGKGGECLSLFGIKLQ